MNAVVKYPGAKWSIAKWIIDMMPPHHSYLEPFFGSGGVFFTKGRSNIETINDLDGDVVNLFSWIRDDPERLAKELYWIPYARDIYDKAFEDRLTERDSFKRAVNFAVRLMMGYGFRTCGEKVGWKRDIQGREAAYAARQWCDRPQVLMEAAERLRGVQIENRDAVELIQNFNHENVLVYADPPYLLGTRCRKQYNCEMEDCDHERLLQVLLRHKGPVILSGYESDLYNDILCDWHKETTECYDQASNKKKEVVWMNFEPQRDQQMSFIDGCERLCST